MKYRNPCGSCIVRATCTSRCEDIKQYSELFTRSVILLSAFVFCILTVALIGSVWQRYGWVHGVGLGSFLLVVGYSTSMTFIIKDWKSFKNHPKKHEQVLVIIFGPWLFLSGMLYSILDDELDLFVYRYNRKIMNSYLQEMWKNKYAKRQVRNVRIHWPIWQSKGDD